MRLQAAAVLRAGAGGFGAGVLLALVALAALPLVEPVSVPALTEAGAAGTSEHWIVRDEDILAVTSGPAGTEPSAPAGIGPLTETRLAAADAVTMKLRNRDGVVIGIASRLEAPQGSGRAALWTFVLGPRGTLAAEVTQAGIGEHGRLIGGTGEFQAVLGQFTESPRPEPGLRYRLGLVRER